MNKRTKIVATLGPSSSSVEVITKLIRAGANVFRLNFSHGTHETHEALIKNIREASKQTNTFVGILGDLCGPKIRVGTFPKGPVTLKEGQKFILSQDPALPGDETRVGTSYPYLVKDVAVGATVLLDDGNIILKTVEKGADHLVLVVTGGGVLKDKKGMNLPGMKLSVETITEKDRRDLRFMIEQGLDFVALSFVRSAQDLKDLRKLIGESRIRVVAKIEKPEAIDDLEAILGETNGIMIARGDLGVEVPLERVPFLQKHILKRCSRRGIKVITATQMLESMITSQRPTRAETTDVFNAVLDGTDAVMLSGETASGQFPVEAVKVMASIAEEAETLMKSSHSLTEVLPEVCHEVAEVVAHSACEAAVDVKARAIVAFTHSGNTALNISKYHPEVSVFALSPLEETCRRLALCWGVQPLLVPDSRNTDEMIEQAEKILVKSGIVCSGDILVISAGVPLGVKGNTNFMKLHRVK